MALISCSNGLRLGLKALGAAAALAALSVPAAAQNYPTRPVRVVVAYPPGATTDAMARMLAGKLSEINHQQFVVENRAGAAGDVGTDFVAKSAPDGYTLAYVSGPSPMLSAALKPNLSYSPVHDFEQIALVGSFAQVLIVPPSFGVTDLKSFVEKVKKEPGKYNYASSGLGGIVHTVIAGFLDVAGLDMVHVPYAGSAPAMTDLMAARASLSAASPTLLKSALSGGKVVPIAIATAKRSPVFKDVPTVSESGYPEYDKMSTWLTWHGVAAPRGTPRAVVDKLNADINTALKDPTISKRMEELGLDNMVGSTPETTRAFFEKEQNDWILVTKRLNIKLK